MLVPFLFNISLLSVLHYTIPASRSKWVSIHCIVNAVVTWLTFGDMWSYIVDPLSPRDSDNCFPLILVLLLHVYHILCYPCVFMDYVHHIVMCSLISVPLLASSKVIALSNTALFFVCGLPGGIDYYNMYRVDQGQLPSLLEKKFNSWLNIYLRAPGILYTAYLVWIHYLNNYPVFNQWYSVLVVFAFIWNAQYFATSKFYRLSAAQQSSRVDHDQMAHRDPQLEPLNLQYCHCLAP